MEATLPSGGHQVLQKPLNCLPQELVWPSAGISHQAPRDLSWPSQRRWLKAGLDGVVGVLEPGCKSGAELVSIGPFFYWVVYFSGIELHELLVYFGN